MIYLIKKIFFINSFIGCLIILNLMDAKALAKTIKLSSNQDVHNLFNPLSPKNRYKLYPGDFKLKYFVAKKKINLSKLSKNFSVAQLRDDGDTEGEGENQNHPPSMQGQEFLVNQENLIGQIPNEEFLIKKIEVINNTVLQPEIEAIIQPYQDKQVTLEELDQVANKITELYLNGGYISSRAVLAQINEDDVAIIEVYEGEVEEIKIEGAERLGDYVRQRISLGTSTPLNSGKLEDQLRLLKTNPLLENIEASLKQGSGDRQSILEVKVTEAEPFFGDFGFDNYSPPSIGGVEMVLNLGYRNVSGLGDGFFLSYRPRVETLDGTYNLDFAYSVPLNPMEGTLQARVLLQNNTVINDLFEELNISGESQYYELIYRQPLIRNPREELALSVGMSYRNGQTFTFQGPTPFGLGPDEDGISRTNVISFGQDYTLRQTTGAWAFRSQFRVGVGIFDVTENPYPIPDGHFFAWLGQIQRVQVIDDNNFLIIQGDIQLTPNSLLPSEQFVIGGAQSVRGYRQNLRAGDNGFRFSVEDRITLIRNDEEEPVFQLAPFFDMGSIWNSGNNPNFLASQRFIAGLGLGFIWQPLETMNIRLDYAPPLVNLSDRGNDVQDDGFYFRLNYNF
jgi:hemolysin activation/secretion protein